MGVEWAWTNGRPAADHSELSSWIWAYLFLYISLRFLQGGSVSLLFLFRSIYEARLLSSIEVLQKICQMSSQRYTFKPLELRPFDRIDVPGLHIEDVEIPQPRENTAFFDDVKSNPSAFASSIAYDPASYATMHDSSDRGLLDQHASLRTSFLQRKSRQFATLWVIAALAIFASIFSIWYSYRVLVDETALPSSLALPPGATVLVVNILSHVVAYLCWSLFSDTAEALRWALACRPEGILLTSFLVLSRATPFIGVAYLCTTKGPHQIWALQR